KGENYHVTICSEVLEHLIDPRAMLLALRQVTRSDGFCIITVPNGLGAFESSVRLRRRYDTSRLRKLYHRLRVPIRMLRGRPPPRPPAASDSPVATLNAESGHVQFFRWVPLLLLIEEAGFAIEAHRGRTLLCGPF